MANRRKQKKGRKKGMTAANARKHKKRETIETHRTTTTEKQKTVHSYTLDALYVYVRRHILGIPLGTYS